MAQPIIDLVGIGVKETGSEEEKTDNLRVANGVLQQEWNILTFSPGRVVTVTKEWRDVPQVTI
jgi:hypothetical protein